MDEQERLLAETEDTMERALLEAGREDRASSEARRRTLEALGLAATGAGAAAVARPWWSAAWVKVAGLAALAVGAAATAWGVGRSGSVAAPTPPPPPAIAEPASPSNVEPAPPATVAAALPAPSAEPPSAPSPRSLRGAGVSVARAPSATSPPSAPAAGLAEEIATIDRARRALYDHDAHGALRALDEHDRRFPRGTLGPEAQLLRVEALLAAGDRPAAEALGAKLLAETPSGPQAERVRALLRR